MASTVGNPSYRVALMGFESFELQALDAYLLLAQSRTPSYGLAAELRDAELIIANGDHVGVIDALMMAGRMRDTLLVGRHARQGAAAWLERPIDPVHLFRALDTAVRRRTVIANSTRVTPRHVTEAELREAWANEALPFDGGPVSLRVASSMLKATPSVMHPQRARLRAAPLDASAAQTAPAHAPATREVSATGRARPAAAAGAAPSSDEGRASRPQKPAERSPNAHPEALPAVTPRLKLDAPAMAPSQALLLHPGAARAPRAAVASWSTATHGQLTPVPRPAPPLQGEPMLALVVGADDTAALNVAMALQAHGISSERVFESRRAFAALQQDVFDLIVIDVDLGFGSDLDGLSLAQAIKRQVRPQGEPCAPIFLVSSRPTSLEHAQAMLAGADAYLASPLARGSMNAALEAVELRAPGSASGHAAGDVPRSA